MQIFVLGHAVVLSGAKELGSDIHIAVVDPGPSPAGPVIAQVIKGEQVGPFDEALLSAHLDELDPDLSIVVDLKGTSKVHLPDFAPVIGQARRNGRDLTIRVID